MKLSRNLVFLFYYTKGGCETNLELLTDFLSTLGISYTGVIYSQETVSEVIRKSYTDLGFNFVDRLRLQEFILSRFDKDSPCLFYFQDISLIPLLKTSFPRSKLVYEVHILQREILNRFQVSKSYSQLNSVLREKITESSIMKELMNIKHGARFEHDVLPLVDTVISNSSNTTESLVRNFPSLEVLSADLTSVAFTSHSRSSINRTVPFIFWNVPTIFKGFHHLLRSGSVKIDVYGNREPYASRFDRELLLKRGIEFKGWISTFEEKLKIFDAHSFALFPSDYESRGLSLDECLRRGIICFCQKSNPGFTDQVQHGKSGFLIDFHGDWEGEIQNLLATYTDQEFLEISHQATKNFNTHSTRFVTIKSKIIQML